VADGVEGLTMIDISDPEEPRLEATYNTDGYALGVFVSGDCVYVAGGSADGTEGLQVFCFR
jgi:hypothetical protein